MPDQLKEKISKEISQSKEKIAQNLKLHELSQDLNDLMKTVSETSNEIATGISSITAKARWLENGNHYYFLQKIKNVCSVQCLLFSELGEVKSSIDDSQITSKISKVFNRLDSSIEKTEKKISSFEENLSKKLEDAIDFTSSVSAADLCAIVANELDKKVIQVRKNKQPSKLHKFS